MRGDSDIKKAKNFKDIKKSIITKRPSQNENQPTANVEADTHPSLSFKRLNTNRDEEAGCVFMSPTKTLVIDTRPIENIDLSSQKKKLFMKYKPSSYQSKESKLPVARNDSATSCKSDSSHKKNLYSQFSQLAQASSKEKKVKAITNNLCFNRLERKESEGPTLVRKTTLNANKPVTLVKETSKQSKCAQVKCGVAGLKKHQSEGVVQVGHRKSTSPRPSTIPQKTVLGHQTPELQPAPVLPDTHQPSQYIVDRKESAQSIPDQVRVSMTFSKELDMSPYI